MSWGYKKYLKIEGQKRFLDIFYENELSGLKMFQQFELVFNENQDWLAPDDIITCIFRWYAYSCSPFYDNELKYDENYPELTFTWDIIGDDFTELYLKAKDNKVLRLVETAFDEFPSTDYTIITNQYELDTDDRLQEQYR